MVADHKGVGDQGGMRKRFGGFTVSEDKTLMCGSIRNAPRVSTTSSKSLQRERRLTQAGDLSDGQQKVVEFAKAYLQRPRLCLIDEPSIGLSPKIAEEVYGWIDLSASARVAILLVDHNVRRVVKMSHHIYVLKLMPGNTERSRQIGEPSSEYRRGSYVAEVMELAEAGNAPSPLPGPARGGAEFPVRQGGRIATKGLIRSGLADVPPGAALSYRWIKA
jgi:hypothetical protein